MVAGYSRSTGDVLFDQSIPIDDADSSINTGIFAYAQTLDLWGHTSDILLSLPYSWGTTRGLLDGNPAKSDFSDFGDLDVTMTVNLWGAPTMATTSNNFC